MVSEFQGKASHMAVYVREGKHDLHSTPNLLKLQDIYLKSQQLPLQVRTFKGIKATHIHLIPYFQKTTPPTYLLLTNSPQIPIHPMKLILG